MANRLAGKTVYITGAAGGVGQATAQLFSQEGAFVVCADINEAAAKERAQALPSPGMAIRVDVTDEASVNESVEQVIAARGGLDVLVNNAGIAGPQTPVGDTPLNEWSQTLGINLTGPFLTCRAALPHLIKSKGNVVNVASSLALIGWRDECAYGASKAGLVQLTKGMALDYAGRVRVNCVCPGAVRTPMIVSVLPEGSDVEKTLEEYGQIHPLHRRLADPLEIANGILFLASEDASLMTGTIMPVDAGFSVR